MTQHFQTMVSNTRYHLRYNLESLGDFAFGFAHIRTAAPTQATDSQRGPRRSPRLVEPVARSRLHRLLVMPGVRGGPSGKGQASISRVMGQRLKFIITSAGEKEAAFTASP